MMFLWSQYSIVTAKLVFLLFIMSLCFAAQSHSGEFTEYIFTTVDQLEKLRSI